MNICTVENCNIKTKARGYCRKHYERWKSNGAPLTKTNMELPLAEYFWTLVNKDGPIPNHRPDLGQCWEFTGSLDSSGYGSIHVPVKERQKYFNRNKMKAHRLSFYLLESELPKMLDHKCHNTICVNPNHLRPATSKTNSENLRGANKNSTSNYRGVHWDNREKKWSVSVTHNGVAFKGGLYSDVEEANKVAIEIRNNLFTFNDVDRITT